MSYTDTSHLGLAKADPGTNQAFETVVFNDNLDKIDTHAGVVDAAQVVQDGRLTAVEGRATSVEGRVTAVEGVNTAQGGRLDAIEANNWVTNARIADNAVGSAEIVDGSVSAAELASSLVLTGKTVTVATQNPSDSSGLVASTSFVQTVSSNVAASVANTAVGNNNFSKNLPVRMQAGVQTMTTGGSGDVSVALSGFVSAPVVVASLLSPGAGTSGALVIVVSSVTTANALFRVYNQAGNVVSGVSVTFHWQAMAY